MKRRKSVKTMLVAVVFLVSILIPSMAAYADEPSWTELTSMSDTRDNFKTEVINGKIYAIGGRTGTLHSPLSSIEVYDPDTDTWTTLQPMSTARSFHQTEAINGKIYVIGGRGSSSTLSLAEVYDPDTNIWTTLASMTVTRWHFQTEVIDGKIYAIGGVDDNNAYLSSAEVYDPDTNTWTTLASMSTPRAYFETAVVDGKIYVLYGKNSGGTLSSAEVYDPDTDTWTTLASALQVRYDFQTEVLDGKIYAIGGSARLSSVERYDPNTDAWTTLASMDSVRAQFQTEIINGEIYAIGGFDDNNDCVTSVEVYDQDTNTWASAASMNIGRRDFQTEVIDGTVYAIGGYEYDGNYAISSVECYTPGGIVPDAPANLTATAGDTQVSLAWDTVSGATSYTVMRATTQGGPYTAIATGETGTSYTDTDVTNGVTYYYVVTAVNDNGESAYSNEASATPTTMATLTATAGNGQVSLAWGLVPSATSYTVTRAETPGGPYTTIATGVTESSYTDTDVTNGTTYYYVVVGMNGEVECAYSNEASATPAAPAFNALLQITMVTGEIKECEMDATEIGDFLSWCASEGAGSPAYGIEKDYNLGPFNARTEYIIYDKISSYEVMQY